MASPKPREMMKFIIVAVSGGLVGAFLSMFFMQVKFRVAWLQFSMKDSSLLFVGGHADMSWCSCFFSQMCWIHLLTS